MPEPSIEQIERDIQRARFEEGEGDKFLAYRAQRRMHETRIQGMKDEKVRRAYVAGFKAGYEEPRVKWPAVLFALAIIALIAAKALL